MYQWKVIIFGKTKTGLGICGNSVLSCNSNKIPKLKDYFKKTRTFAIELRSWKFLGLQAFFHPWDVGIIVFVVRYPLVEQRQTSKLLLATHTVQ